MTAGNTPRYARSRQSGVVLIMLLLGLFLLAGLVLMVMNTGQQTNARVVAQNAADASAASGAGWVARTFDTVAMNNTGIAELIAAVAYEDSMPEGIEYTLTDQTAFFTAIQNQAGRGVSEGPVLTQMMLVANSLQQEIAWLQEANNVVNIKTGTFYMPNYTYYNINGGHGKFWDAMYAMDNYSQTSMLNLGVFAQVNAVVGGNINMTQSPGETLVSGNLSMLVPAVPTVPYNRTSFEDFYYAVVRGLLPPGTDDKQYNRGPYDAIYGWRTPKYQTTSYQQITPPTPGGKGKSSWSDGGGSPGTGTTSGIVVSYSNYGPFHWLGDVIGGYSSTDAGSQFPYSRLSQHISELAAIKISYIWPQEASYGPNRPVLSNSGGPMHVIGYRNRADKNAGRPAWNIALVKDYHYWFDGPGMYRSNPPLNMFYLEDGVNVSSDDLVLKVSDQGNGRTVITYISQATQNWIYDVVASDGTPVLVELGQGTNKGLTGVYSTEVPTPPYTVIQPRWVTDWQSAQAIASTGTQAIYESAWLQIVFTHTVTTTPAAKQGDPPTVSDTGTAWTKTHLLRQRAAILVPPGLDATNQTDNYIWLDDVISASVTDPVTGVTTQRRTANYYIFLGINVGTPVPVRNPANFTDRSALPAPIDFDHTLVKPQPDARRQYLTYLAAARRPDTALMWSDRFSSNKPDPSMMAIAQIELFNNHSFDLWTQEWHAQLVRVTNMSDWVTQLQASLNQLAGLNNPNPNPNGPQPAPLPPQMITAPDATLFLNCLQASQNLSDAALSH